MIEALIEQGRTDHGVTIDFDEVQLEVGPSDEAEGNEDAFAVRAIWMPDWESPVEMHGGPLGGVSLEMPRDGNGLPPAAVADVSGVVYSRAGFSGQRKVWLYALAPIS